MDTFMGTSDHTDPGAQCCFMLIMQNFPIFTDNQVSTYPCIYQLWPIVLYCLNNDIKKGTPANRVFEKWDKQDIWGNY